MGEPGREAAVVRAPATSANLGPGFDSFGLALSLHDVVRAEVVADGLDIEITGQGADTAPRDGSHLVVSAMRRTFERLGVAGPPGLRLRCDNRIPHGRGLGSSAAAIVSGIRLAQGLVADHTLDDRAVVALASEIEGHPDNVAACVLGGFTIATGGGEVARFDPHEALRPVAIVAPHPVGTTAARALLPTRVSHADASANAARAGLLAAALTIDPRQLVPATEDLLHQRYRRSAMPEALDLVDGLRDAGLAAVVSGAGPTVLVLGTAGDGFDAGAWTPAGWRCLPLAVDPEGARLSRR
jgi:homoserine kinase